jgi:hypothetical protein
VRRKDKIIVRPSLIRSWSRGGELGYAATAAVAEDRGASVIGTKDGGKLTFRVLGDSGKYEKRADGIVHRNRGRVCEAGLDGANRAHRVIGARRTRLSLSIKDHLRA